MYNISISTKAYVKKPTDRDYREMKFKEQVFDDLFMFFDKVKRGYSFCNNMNSNGNEFNCEFKTNKHFSYTNYVVLDFDGVDVTPRMFYQQSTMPPTYLYTSFHHLISEGLNKFHAVYFFNEKITNETLFKDVYDAICSQIKMEFKSIKTDNNMRSVAQCSNGTLFLLPNFEEYYNEDLAIYSITDFTNNRVSPEKTYALTVDERTCCPVSNNNIPPSSLFTLNGQFEQDLKELSPYKFIRKYGDFEYKEKTDSHFNENHYQILSDTDAEIWSIWRTEKIYGRNRHIKERIKKGEGKRRNALKAHGLVFRHIFPNISNEHLVYCLIHDVYYNFDNTDGKYTNEKICEIAKLCQNFDMSNYTPKHLHQIRIDCDWCKSNFITPQAYAQKVRKMRTDEKISEYYDENLSVRRNTEILNNK